MHKRIECSELVVRELNFRPAQSPIIPPNKLKFQTTVFHVENWIATGVQPIIVIVKHHLAGSPTFKAGILVLDIYSTGELAIVELKVTLDVDLTSVKSGESSGELKMFFAVSEL